MLIVRSEDIEVNPGYHHVEDLKDIKGIKMAHPNVQSIRNKVDLLRLELINDKVFDILTLSETWLNDSISDTEIQMPEYSVVCKDRSENKLGGGTIIYIRDGLPFNICTDLNTDENECLWIRISRPKCKPIFLYCVYRPPNSDLTNFISTIQNSIENIGLKNSDIILLGDFNVDFTTVKRKSNPARKTLMNFVRSMDLNQLIKEATRVTDSSQTMSIVLLPMKLYP